MAWNRQFKTSGSIHPLTLVENVARIMRDEGVHILPVVENGELKGVVTDRDLVVRCLAEGKDVLFTRAADHMTAQVMHCEIGESSASVFALMKLRGHSKLPLLDAAGSYLGMLDLDVCRKATGAITADLVGSKPSRLEAKAKAVAA